MLREIGSTQEGAALLADLHEAFISFAETVTTSLGRIEEGLKDPADRSRVFTNGSHPEALIRRVEVATAGTPVQGPSIEIPEGINTVIRQRRSTGIRNGYVAVNEHDVTNTSLRTETQNGDVIGLRISNWSKLWFDADTSGTEFELISEQ
ncbi:MAG: hypothetical protein COA89_12840 [Acidithiobacillus sp.]|nr:MAG: hypothetical protein COA89_12840 [Acidithiobacillus sp.]